MRATDRKMLVWRMETSDYYRAFSHDVTAAILVFHNNQTVAILVFQTNPVGVELFSYANSCFYSHTFAYY